MAIDITTIGADEVTAFLRTTWTAFGEHPTEGALHAWSQAVEPDRAFAARDGETIAGSACTFSMALTVPGPEQIDAGGLSMVGVLPSHRRRGLLRRLMAAHLDDVRERGEPIAMLTASESVIYGRFGYGPATHLADYRIETRTTAFAGEPPPRANLELCSREEIERCAPQVHERVLAATPGEVRASGIWDGIFADLDERAADGAGWFHVVHRDGTGDVDGYALWRVADESWADGLPTRRVRAWLEAASDETRLSLWRFLLELDLVVEVRLYGPLDEPLRWRLADPRRLRTAGVADHLWLKLVDVPAALGARRYGQEGAVVLRVVDGFGPDTSGTYRLEGGPEGAVCTRTGGEADLTCSAATLGALYLGGVSAQRLHRVGRIEEATAGAVARLDAMLHTSILPFCGTDF